MFEYLAVVGLGLLLVAMFALPAWLAVKIRNWEKGLEAEARVSPREKAEARRRAPYTRKDGSVDWDALWAAEERESELAFLEKIKAKPYSEYYVNIPRRVREHSEEWDRLQEERERRIREIMSSRVSSRAERVERLKKAYAVRGIWPPDEEGLEIEAYREEKRENAAAARREAEESRALLLNTRHIPNDVKAEAMRRAGGQCVLCGAEEELAFDHIIPFSRGGSSKNAENIQVLCGPCNRRKRDRLG